tara:strand:+ start:24491 stop:24790 length:300 start_codon:yes stop_codon:yes gene_type:complete
MAIQYVPNMFYVWQMHRIDNEYLETMIAVAIKTAPKTVKQGMRSSLPAVRDEAVSHIAKHIVGHLSNASTMVIKTEIVGAIGCSGRPGVWGLDEPNPTA